MCLHHHGEYQAVEHDVVLANEVYQPCVLVLPPFLPCAQALRVFLAQLFAQDPQILVLDEPANHLDLQYQKQLFSLLEKWQLRSSVSKARGIISVVHDLSLAKAFGNQVLLLHEGKVRGFGRPDEVLSRERLEAVYGMDVYAWFHQLLSGWN